MNETRYIAPRSRAERGFNAAVAWLTARGVSLFGSRMLWVRGRSTGQWRQVPVNPLEHDGRRYLVAPRGHTQWVRNLRVAGEGELHLGRKVERFTASELDDAAKPDVLRAYLRRWKWEVGAFFDGVDADAPADALARISPNHPVFVLDGVDASW
jgi:deazaflavin-dependent oxidoreductase (nitroreductase family)